MNNDNDTIEMAYSVILIFDQLFDIWNILDSKFNVQIYHQDIMSLNAVQPQPWLDDNVKDYVGLGFDLNDIMNDDCI